MIKFDNNTLYTTTTKRGKLFIVEAYVTNSFMASKRGNPLIYACNSMIIFSNIIFCFLYSTEKNAKSNNKEISLVIYGNWIIR